MICWRVSLSDLVFKRSGGEESRKKSAGLYAARWLSLLHTVVDFRWPANKGTRANVM